MSTCLILICQGYKSIAQTFQNVASEQNVIVYSFNADYGSGVTFFDYNNDGWDDLTVCRNGLSIRRFRNEQGVLQEDDPISNSADVKQVTYVDIDNDSDYDILITSINSTLRLLLNNQGELEDISLSSGLIQNSEAVTFGAAWADYDKDGYLDLYVCNYNWDSQVYNWLFRNNGDNTFTEQSQLAGINSQNHLSFQPTWLDYNHDNWPDLYIIDDKYPPNKLFKNLGNGTFENVSSQSNSDIVRDAMSNTVGDFNHDGHLDIYISDSNSNVLLKNLGNEEFEEVADEFGLTLGTNCWGAQWLDFDNDGNRDLHVLNNTIDNNNQNHFFKQTSEGEFISYSEAFLFNDQGESYISSIGDLNNDGFTDILVGSTQGVAARLWLNSGNENAFLKVDLEGQISNRDGIGTWIHCYLNGNQEVEYTLCGESYLSQNSHSDIFGLGNASMVDSLILEWPSGHIDSFYNIPANQSLNILEGSSLEIAWPQDTVYLCFNDTLSLEINGFDTYQWSHGPDSNKVDITEPGFYTLTASTSLGIVQESDTLTVLAAPIVSYEILTTNPSCIGSEDGSLTVLEADELGLQLTWMQGTDSISSTDLSAGNYQLTIVDSIGCSYSEDLVLTDPDPFIWIITTEDVLCFGDSTGSIEARVEGGTLPYDIELPYNGSGLPEGSFWAYLIDGHQCEDSTLIEIQSNPDLSFSSFYNPDIPENDSSTVIIEPSGGLPPYSIEWLNGDSLFEIILLPGEISFVIFDSLGCELQGSVLVPTNIIEANNNPFLIYPNPAKEYLVVKTFSSAQQNLIITDITGRIILKKELNPNENFHTILLSSIVPGSYLIYLSTNSHSLDGGKIILIE
jgi:hypothetical protein